ncbi:Phosphatidylinositol-specific phospholipase [Beauveria brongniartii RCEF 3172]|uniref:Phosphatidylinositol-specific phospholipase n=1 Tax=Beauveria brongniartii RCEF 3172 TaxID=1081107 RepID=A0A166YCF3_9HYPO|nr:Phosphatidylinositol-specific phospholipase [Beauveria brongniartii RCEF 3172]
MRPQSPIPLSNRRRSPDLSSRPFISSSSSYSPSSPSPPSSPLLRKHSPDAAPLLPPPPPHHHHRRTTTYYLSWLALAAFIALSIMMLLRTVLLTAAAAPCAVSAACYHGFHSAFSFDAHLLASSPHHAAAWMGALRNDTLLTSLSIPGTHDTMTYAIGSDVLQCQNWNLSVQLAAGLRYFDVRARLRDDQLRIYHGDGDTGFGYQDVLLEVFGFLAQNPSEAVVMRVKQEGKPLGQRNTLTFEEAFNYYRHNSSITAKQAARHMHNWDPAAPLPALGDLRSKVLVLQDFPADHDGPANKYGVAWDDGKQMVLEDRWIVPDVHHLRDKWTAIREALERAAGDVQDNKALYLSHISASVGVLPIEAAAGPKNGSVVGMNDETGRWLESGDQTGRTGVVIFDFPGKRAIEAVLARNAAYNA